MTDQNQPNRRYKGTNVSNKWVFKLKRNLDDTLQRYKVTLVAKSFHQTPRIDLLEPLAR